MELSTVDIVVYLMFILTVSGIGYFVGRRQEATVQDYFRAGNRVPWFAIGVSIIAASISTEQFLGEVGYAYQHGLAVANWEWANVVAQLILAFIFIPVFLRERIATIPAYLARRFDERCSALFAGLLVVSYVVINLAGVLYLGGFAIEVLFGVNKWAAVWVLVAIAGAYTIYGGLASVVWTDLLNGGVLLAGGVLVFVLGWLALPGGLQQILGTGSRSHLILPASHPDLPWTAILALALTTNVFYYCTDQYINQRCLAARTEWDARMGVIFSAFLGIPLALAVTFPGMIAYALNPSLEIADQAYPYVVAQLVPQGLRGIIFAALTGAVLSTIASLISSSSAIVSMDLYRSLLKPDASERQMIRTGRYTGLAVLIFGGLWSPVVTRFEMVFAYFQESWVFFAAPIAVVFVTGILWKRATSTAAFSILMLGFPMLSMGFLRREFFPDLNPFNLAGLSAIALLVLMILISLWTTSKSQEETKDHVWNRTLLVLSEKRFASRWLTSEKLWAILLIIIYSFIYAWLW